MYRIVAMGSGLYCGEIDSIEDDVENLNDFVSQSEPCILIEDLEDLEKFGLSEDDLIMVNKEE